MHTVYVYMFVCMNVLVRAGMFVCTSMYMYVLVCMRVHMQCKTGRLVVAGDM